MAKSKTAEGYRALPYFRKVDLLTEDAGSSYYVARIKEIPWIEADGETREEALLKLDEVFEDAIEAMLHAGDEVPGPKAWPESLGYVHGQASSGKASRVSPSWRKQKVVEIELLDDASPFTEFEKSDLVLTG